MNKRIAKAYGLKPPSSGSRAAKTKLKSDLEAATAEAHKMCFGFLVVPCGKLLLKKGVHHPLELAIASAMVSAFYAGKRTMLEKVRKNLAWDTARLRASMTKKLKKSRYPMSSFTSERRPRER